MRLLSDEDYACFTDGDVVFLTPDFGTIINDYITLYPNTVLTCRTNRIHKLSKQLDGTIDEVCDLRELIKRAEERKHLRSVTEIKPGDGMSGFLMIVPKEIWNEVKFIENGLLGVDSQFRMDLHTAGKKIYIMDGMLVHHTYRLLNGQYYKNHLTA